MPKKTPPPLSQLRKCKTIKYGKRGDAHRYRCKACNQGFTINYSAPTPLLWIEHIDGVGFRRLGDENGLSGSQTYARVIAEMDQLPQNDFLTQTLCDPKRFSGIFNHRRQIRGG